GQCSGRGARSGGGGGLRRQPARGPEGFPEARPGRFRRHRHGLHRREHVPLRGPGPLRQPDRPAGRARAAVPQRHDPPGPAALVARGGGRPPVQRRRPGGRSGPPALGAGVAGGGRRSRPDRSPAAAAARLVLRRRGTPPRRGGRGVRASAVRDRPRPARGEPDCAAASHHYRKRL
ncbi:MAG: hypothetical protein AVDCRST_MAG08-2962, partial [uncultured Acetobacteraceae bacterium]